MAETGSDFTNYFIRKSGRTIYDNGKEDLSKQERKEIESKYQEVKTILDNLVGKSRFSTIKELSRIIQIVESAIKKEMK